MTGDDPHFCNHSIYVSIDLVKHRGFTKTNNIIAHTTNQTESQQIKLNVGVWSEGKLEYLGKNQPTQVSLSFFFQEAF